MKTIIKVPKATLNLSSDCMVVNHFNSLFESTPP